MVKLALIVAALLAVLAFANANEDEEVPAFVKIFNELHKDPAPQQVNTRANVKTLWIEQKLDHFDANETRTWQMRYMSNDEFFKPGGPIFIYVGGEWFISPGFITGGHVYDMAKEHNGYLFYTEHRFYGESKPTEHMTNENLQYLSVQQALADLAHFIRTMKATIPGLEHSKTILTGGSYSATMVTWFKKLYPDLAAGCWASSAPLYARIDYYEYKEIMGQSIKLVSGDTCHDRIKRGFDELESMFANKRGAEVKAMLKLCNSFNENNDLDVWTLFYEISELFANLIQAHNDGDIQSACRRIMDGSSDVIGLANYIVYKFNARTCTDMSYRGYLNMFKDSAYSTNIIRQWFYQTCNEYGWYQTSASMQQPFGTKFPAKLYTTLCQDAYGEEFTEEYIENQVKKTNEFFGGLQLEVENVYMTHGQLDPWRAMGIQEEGKATIIPMRAHCKDFGSITDKDNEELKASKIKLKELVKEWLKE
ncbi:putative serine protease K12H4.7 isoform X2 [Lucilia cuprina]|uniref:putative serine protease K12H4.7 isoform X2 n=1 Tax=Lucilia cuprina TaxID=7375 RepID=UPI001F058BB9|nr:putative serine protease K12H4.7 isoform X2 [Lucilia cuprina]